MLKKGLNVSTAIKWKNPSAPAKMAATCMECHCDYGKVVGVMAKDKSGETIKINAKAVVVATGGFANNNLI